MLLRSGSKRLHIRFFVVFDAHGPCVHKYLLLSHCQGGALNRDFRSVHVVCWINNFTNMASKMAIESPMKRVA